MIRDDQSSSSRMLSRAETDAINSILDEEEIRIGQFSSLSPNLSALDEQCKQIWSNWESIPASVSKPYTNNNNNNDFNNSSPRISSNPKPSAQFDLYDAIPKRTEKYKLSTPTNNKGNDFDDSITMVRYADKPKSNRYDEMFSHQDYSSPAAQPRTTFTTKFETTTRPPPSIDDISDFSTKPSTFSQRSPSYQESRSIDPLKNLGAPIDSNPIRRNRTEFDYNIPSKASMKSDLLENDVGNLKNELNSLMAKVRTASRSPTSVNLGNSPSHSDPFSKERTAPTSNYSRTQTTNQAYDKITSPSYQSSRAAAFDGQERFSSPKSSFKTMNNNYPSSSPKVSSNRYIQNSYNMGLNDDSFLPPNSMSTNDDDTFAEPINVQSKIPTEHKLPPTANSATSNLNPNLAPSANQSSASQPEILLLRQENVRLKAELLKVQKQLQAEHEEKENIKLSLVKCEQLRQRYKERIKMYEKQMGIQQQSQQNK